MHLHMLFPVQVAMCHAPAHALPGAAAYSHVHGYEPINTYSVLAWEASKQQRLIALLLLLLCL